MTIAVSGVFDKIDVATFRFLDEASRLGPLTAYLWSDDVTLSATGIMPEHTLSERQYVLDALRYVTTIEVVESLDSADSLPPDLPAGATWLVREEADSDAKREACASSGVDYKVIAASELTGFPVMEGAPTQPDGPSIIVTGCYDWFHSGHVRFFEEVSEHGNLHVVVGNDANVEHLKGEGHPMFEEDLRRYMVQSIRFVTQAYIATGHGWLDAEPEIARLKPDIYAVNMDGNRPEKREFCEEHGLKYLVLKRDPKPGLPRRSSTDLRGF